MGCFADVLAVRTVPSVHGMMSREPERDEGRRQPPFEPGRRRAWGQHGDAPTVLANGFGPARLHRTLLTANRAPVLIVLGSIAAWSDLSCLRAL
jgi:hypothetical protein